MKKIIFGIILLILAGIIIFIIPQALLCFFKNLNDAKGSTSGIAESKKMGLFIAEYSITPNSFTLPDGKKIRFNEVWLEKIWDYKDKCEGTITISNSKDRCYLYITFHNDGISYFGYSGIPCFTIAGKQETMGGSYLGDEGIVNYSKILDSTEIMNYRYAGFDDSILVNETFTLTRN